MGFSQEWEQRYSQNTHMSVWPWSDVVSLVHRYCRHLIDKKGRVLELGCGAGANIPLFLSLGMDYYSVEGSATVVSQLHSRYPGLTNHIQVGDFTDNQPWGESFDLVLDRASLTCNNTQSIKSGLMLAFSALKPGGYFVGVDWYSTSHSDFGEGVLAEDAFTKKNISVGQFVGTGRVHFSDEKHLRELFSGFDVLLMEEKRLRRLEPKDNHLFASWNIVARKRNG